MMIEVDVRRAFDGFTLNAAFEAPVGITRLCLSKRASFPAYECVEKFAIWRESG